MGSLEWCAWTEIQLPRASLRAPCGFAFAFDHSTVALSLSSCCVHQMAHLAAAWPDQVLCKQNKRNAINEQQRKWMEQREQALSAAASSAPADDLENAAPAAVASNNKRNIAAAPAATDEIADELESLDELNNFLSCVGQSLEAESPEPVVRR